MLLFYGICVENATNVYFDDEPLSQVKIICIHEVREIFTNY